MIIKELSIVIPIYNEQGRIRKNLNKIISLFYSMKPIKIEIILINDGSTDESNTIIKKFLDLKKNNKNKNKIKYLKYIKNRGKGYALKTGVLFAKKKWILTCDADFSSNPTELKRWIKYNYIREKKCCYFGSRKAEKSKIKHKQHRQILGNIFNLLTNFLFNLKIKDSQCGFKLYHSSYGKKIFSMLKEYGYSHDVELAILLKKHSIKIKELPVKWIHEENGPLNLLSDGLNMLVRLFIIKLKS